MIFPPGLLTWLVPSGWSLASFGFAAACSMVLVVGSPPERRPGRVKTVLGGVAVFGFIRALSDRDLDSEHPEFYFSTRQIDELRDLAVQVAAEIPGDAEAVAAIRAAGGKPKQWKRAAAWLRGDDYAREHRYYLRAARLLKAAADGSAPVAASSDEEALFRAVDDLEALSVEDAFAALAAEVPALRALEHRVVTSLSEPGWEDRDEDDRRAEILDDLAPLVGPRAPEGSPLIRSHTAFDHARVYLLGKAGLLDDEEPELAELAEHAELLEALARGYGVAPDVRLVATAISKRVAHRDVPLTPMVVLGLLSEPGIGARLRRGDGPPDSFRQEMTTLIAINVHLLPPRLSPAEFVDGVVEEVRSTLLRDSGQTGDH